MLDDKQLEQVNEERKRRGKRPINTQVMRQNPPMPGDATDLMIFWLMFKMPGDDEVQRSIPRMDNPDPVIEHNSANAVDDDDGKSSVDTNAADSTSTDSAGTSTDNSNSSTDTSGGNSSSGE